MISRVVLSLPTRLGGPSGPGCDLGAGPRCEAAFGSWSGRLLPSRPVLTGIVIAVDVVAGLALIVLVLMHSGRGGGLSDMFGGGLGASAAGSTMVEKNLDRITIVLSITFVFTTIALAFLLQPTT